MKRFISSLLVLTLSFGILLFPGVADVAQAKTLDEYNEEYETLEKELKEKEEKLAQTQGDISDKEAYVSELNAQIANVESQVEVLDERISLLNSDIAIQTKSIEKLAAEILKYDTQIKNLETEITTTQSELDGTFKQLQERLREAYISGESSTLELLLTSKDVSSFLVRAEFIKRTAENDNKLMDTLDKQIAELKDLNAEVKEQRKVVAGKKVAHEKERAELIGNQNDLKSSLNILEIKQKALSDKKTEAASMIDKLDKESLAYKTQIAQIEKDMNAVDALIQQITASVSSGNSNSNSNSNANTNSGTANVAKPNSGGWVWPVAMSGTYVSSPYGYRYHPITGAYRMHTGIDISAGGIHGKPIVASKAGTVIYTNYGYGGGYGNYVIVDHGGGYTTLYAHCNSLAVSNGQRVSQGQTIAYVGTTGASTGPHLHFEVRINGNHTNPSNYVSK